MDADMWITLGILAFAILFFVTEWLRVDVVALSVVILLMVTGILTTGEALAGFSSSVVLTIAALFIVGGGVLQTDLAGMIGRRILKIAGTEETRLIITLMAAVIMLSGFMSNTGTVAVLLPAVVSLARSANVRASKLLIPLAFGASLGGAITLIGTPPNIIVSNTLRDAGMEPFSFFTFTPIGILLSLTGIIYMLVIGRRLLPDHITDTLHQQVESPSELMERYRLPDNIYRLRVRERSKLSDTSVAVANLRHDFDINILEILRPAPQSAVPLLRDQRDTDSIQPIHPTPDTIFRPDDILLVQGEKASVGRAVAFWNLGLQPRTAEDQETLINQEVGIAEILLPPTSEMINKTLNETRFGSTYTLSVLAISRPGESDPVMIEDTPLRVGDALLVQGTWQDILALKARQKDFVVMGQPEAMLGAPNQEKAPLAMGILLGMLLLMVTGVTTVTIASMVAALGMVLTGCLSMDDAYDAIDWKSIVLIAGMLPMATALETVELVDVVAENLTQSVGESGPIMMVGALFLLTAVFTQVLSNTATTVLLAPIALATAQELDVNPEAFLMAIALAASMAFASPVASPVNTLVMGAGNYSFSDYAKVGIPLILITLVVAMLALPVFFPF
ncbi:MAG: SLC13 family permease [Chloroflexi bacterium]|nr:SLC13 family permease [Chloroflexota bacterium]